MGHSIFVAYDPAVRCADTSPSFIWGGGKMSGTECRAPSNEVTRHGA